MSQNNYKIYCVTERRYKYTFSVTPPTVCPTDNGHQVDLLKVYGSTSGTYNNYNNLESNTDPNNTNDISQGYTVGSIWVNQATENGFICVHSEINNTVWKKITIQNIQELINNDLDMTNKKIINLASPISDKDAVNKEYVDNFIAGLDVKKSVYCATTDDLDNNVTIDGNVIYDSNGGTGNGLIMATLLDPDLFILDNISLSSVNNNARILIKNQNDSTQNGIWEITINGLNLTLVRASDFATGSVTGGSFFFIEKGLTLQNTGWVLSTTGILTIGGNNGDELSFTQFSGTGQIIAGDGISKIGNTLNIGGSDTILVQSDELHVNSSSTPKQVLLSSGLINTPAFYDRLPLNDQNSIIGTLSINNGGTNTDSFATANRIIATNNVNTSLISTNINPDNVVTLNDTQTLINKTLTYPTISTINNVGTLTLPATSDTLIGRNTIDIINNKSLNDLTVQFINNIDNTKKFKFNLNNITTGNIVTLNIQNQSDTLIGRETTDILKNKKLVDTSVCFVNGIDDTKRINFDVDGWTNTITTIKLSQTGNRIINLPDASGVVTLNDLSQTLTNKTLIAPIITSISNTGTITFPTSTDTLVGKNTVDILTNKTLIDSLTTIADITDNTIRITFDASGSPGSKTTIKSNQTVDRTINLPNASTMLIGNDTIDTLTNKTLIMPIISTIINTGTITLPTSTDTLIGKQTTDVLMNKTFISNVTNFQDNIDSTKKIQFNLGNLSHLSTRILTVPDFNLTLVGTDITQTLTNKTLILPIISNINNGGTITIPTSTDTLVCRETIDILSNKLFQNNNNFFVDNSDNTKKIGFLCSSASTNTITTINSNQTTNRIVTLPDATDTLIGKNTTDILTNKTLILPVISNIVNIGTLTLPNITDTLIGRQTNDTLSNKKIVINNSSFVDIADNTKKIEFIVSEASTNTKLNLISQQTDNRNITFPDATTTLVGTDVIQTITNKILIGPIFENVMFRDNIDNSKQMKFALSNITTSETRILTIPNASTTLIGIDTIDILTNKTLISPIIATIINTGTLTLPTTSDTLIGRLTSDVLENKLLSTNTINFVDNLDYTKKIGFNSNDALSDTITIIKTTQTSNRIITLPNATTTLVGTDTNQTLTNKTLTLPIISNIINVGTLTLPNTTDTLIGKDTIDLLNNKSLNDINTKIVNNSNGERSLQFSVDGISSTKTIIHTYQTIDRNINLPDASGTLITQTTNDNLSNKSLIADSCYFIDGIDNSKKVKWDIGGSITGTILTLCSSHTTNKIITIPDISDTLITKTSTDNLSNKNLLTNSVHYIDSTDNSKKLNFNLANAVSNTTVAIRSIQTTDRIITLPDANTTLVGTNATQTLTNKTINASQNTIVLGSDNLNNKLWILRDEKTVGTHGGTFTAGAWTTRTLNTLSYNGGTEVTLGTDEFTCTNGKYLIKCKAVSKGVGINQLRLYNYTDSVVINNGLMISPTNNQIMEASLECVINILSDKTFRLEHRCTSTRDNDGYGAATGWGQEVYVEIIITKIG